jgi:L-rhamnose mutarotase
MKRHCLTLDLKNDPDLIRQYEEHHRSIWPEILRSIRESGIDSMEIYRLETRLFMIIEVTDDFSFEKKAEADRANETVQRWEELMWKFQLPLPGSKPGEKWMLMNKIFELKEMTI